MMTPADAARAVLEAQKKATPPEPAVGKCEGCGGNAVVRVRLTNGGLRLCRQCLDEFNAKNPELAALRVRERKLEAGLKRCAQIAWNMHMEQFGGGTAIGNAIHDFVRALLSGEKGGTT